MKIIVLSCKPDIEKTLLSFLPKAQFIIINNIISLHNEIIKHDADAVLLDKNVLPVWNMDITDHLNKCSYKWSCFYFNAATVSIKHIEISRIEKTRKHESFIVTSSQIEGLIGTKKEKSNDERFSLAERLCTQQQELLRFFMNNEGKLLSFKDMSEYLFGSFNEKHKKTLYTYIHTIRLFIEENPHVPKHIIRKKKGFYTYL